MQASESGLTPGAFRRPQLVTPFVAAAIISASLILLQALLAGRGLFDDPDLFDVHEIVANVVFLAVVVQAVLAFTLGVQGSLRTQLLVVNVLLVVLVIAQIALGYGIEDSSEAAAWHVPNGVLLFGLSAYHVALLPRIRR